VSYVSEVIADAPVGYWRFTQNSGMESFDSGSGALPLSHVPSVHIPDIFTGPVLGGVAVGVTGDAWNTWYVNSSPYQSPGTLELWWWSFGGNPLSPGVMGLLGQGNATSSNDRLGISWDQFNFKFNVGSTFNTAAGVVPRQSWHHVAFAFNLTSCLGYIDGALAVTHSSVIGNNSDLQVHLGYNGTNGAFARGIAAEVAVYPTKLSAARIAAHYAAADAVNSLPIKVSGQAGSFPPLVQSWSNTP
jgi:Concanavalin A-like lectin/glucanases superfamily